MITPDLLTLVYFDRKLSSIFVSGDFKDTLELKYWSLRYWGATKVFTYGDLFSSENLVKPKVSLTWLYFLEFQFYLDSIHDDIMLDVKGNTFCRL